MHSKVQLLRSLQIAHIRQYPDDEFCHILTWVSTCIFPKGLHNWLGITPHEA